MGQKEEAQGEQEGKSVNPGILAPIYVTRRPRYNVGAVIGTITPGASYIQNIKFLYPWNTSTVVTSVPAGERFDFMVDYRCINAAGNIIDPWSMCIVFWDDEKDIKGWYFKNSATSLVPTIIDDNAARIANAYTLLMPNHNVILHFNMFANDDNTPTQQYPSESVWSTLR